MSDITVSHNNVTGIFIRSEGKMYHSMQEALYDKNNSFVFTSEPDFYQSFLMKDFKKKITFTSVVSIVIFLLFFLAEKYFIQGYSFSAFGVVFAIIFFLYYSLDAIFHYIITFYMMKGQGVYILNGDTYLVSSVFMEEDNAFYKVVYPLKEAKVQNVIPTFSGTLLKGEFPFYIWDNEHQQISSFQETGMPMKNINQFFLYPFSSSFYQLQKKIYRDWAKNNQNTSDMEEVNVMNQLLAEEKNEPFESNIDNYSDFEKQVQILQNTNELQNQLFIRFFPAMKQIIMTMGTFASVISVSIMIYLLSQPV